MDPADIIIRIRAVRWKQGSNTLRLATEYRQHHWLEEVYLTGSFGVRASGPEVVMTSLPARLGIGDWGAQGLAMYSGAVTHGQTVRMGSLAKGERAVLCLDRPKATVLRVTVNGQEVATLGWEPWRVDITGAVRAGAANRIDITVVSSRRNLLGPLHQVGRNPLWTGPAEFRPKGDGYVASCNLVPYGLMGETWAEIVCPLLDDALECPGGHAQP